MLILLQLQLLDLLLEVSNGTVECNHVSNNHIVGLSVLVDEVRVSAESGQRGSEQESQQGASNTGLLSGLELLGRRANGSSGLSSLGGGLSTGGGTGGGGGHVGGGVGGVGGNVGGGVLNGLGGGGAGGGGHGDLGGGRRHGDGVGSGGVGSGGSGQAGRSGDGSDHFCVCVLECAEKINPSYSFTLLMCCAMLCFRFGRLGETLT